MAYGVLNLKKKDGSKLIFFYVLDQMDVDLDFADASHQDSKGVTSIKEAESKLFGSTPLYTAFFIDGTAFIRAIDATQKKMLIHGLGQMTLVMTLFAIVLVLFGLWRANSIADKMTK